MADRSLERKKLVVRMRGVRVGRTIISPPSVSHRSPSLSHVAGRRWGPKGRWAVRTSQ
ncbi:hypothetical protein CGRA01v4_03505 [Colletotrichum graminicola]|nr:hypothetical protein CGRA01v4_03505 [Colletotrichum graminicola]